jgi:peptide/nickel transport system ATP-binding protein
MAGPVLSIENLFVDLPGGADRKHAVGGLTLSVNPGEIVCVVGESGSGKSVTAQAVMGLLPKGQLTRSGGRIVLEGEDISGGDGVRAVSRRVSVSAVADVVFAFG